MAALAIGAFVSPQMAQASTSGGATIYNTVKVTYQSGTGPTLFATANISVTVTTIPTAPAVTNPGPKTVIAGQTASYDYIVKSNANGIDTYTTSNLANAATNVAAATGTSVTASVQLWGGIVLGSGDGTITVPYGSTAGLTAGSSTVQIGTSTYTVKTITAGTPASTDAATGNLVPETPATIELTLISGTAVTSGSVAAGTQVGEYTTVTAQLVAGAPTTAGLDGSYDTTFKISSTDPNEALTTTKVTTTVSSPRVTIGKAADKATAQPGDVITYTITVTNTHGSASVSNVTVIDPVPAYTSYVANSTRLNGITVAGDGATSPLAGAGLAVDSNGSRAAGAAATGTMPANGVATVVYQVKVD